GTGRPAAAANGPVQATCGVSSPRCSSAVTILSIALPREPLTSTRGEQGTGNGEWSFSSDGTAALVADRSTINAAANAACDSKCLAPSPKACAAASLNGPSV